MAGSGNLGGGCEPPARPAASEKRTEAYERRKQQTFEAARAAAVSIRKRKRRVRITAYSLAKETESLSKKPGSKVRKVSANAIRQNPLCRPLYEHDEKLVAERSPDRFPTWLQLLNKEQLMDLVLADRAWAANSSTRVVELELELARVSARSR
jgi:hypothetical protein